MSPTEKVRVGDYLVVGEADDWRVMEQFGSYRMLKKKFKTMAAASKRAECASRLHQSVSPTTRREPPKMHTLTLSSSELSTLLRCLNNDASAAADHVTHVIQQQTGYLPVYVAREIKERANRG